MKITLAVLFLAGLTIYCKCTAVLSLPPSLIAHAASLEERLKTQKPSTSTTNTDNAGIEDEQLQQHLQDAEESAADFYKNLKNLWQKDLNLQKRERNTFEDDIVNVATQQQQQQSVQPIATIKNNNKIAPEQNIPPQPQQPDNANNNNNNKNILKTSSSATVNEATNLNIDTKHEQQQPRQQQLASGEYDSNEWLAPGTDDMTDDIIVQPPSSPLLPLLGEETNVEPIDMASTLVGSLNSADEPDSVVWNKYLKPLKYWTRQCQSETENNCPQEYYRALIADRKNALLKQLQYKENIQPVTLNYNPLNDYTTSSYDSLESSVTPASAQHPYALHNINNNDDDILLLLTAEQNLIQFLSWALAELYPFGKFENMSGNGADFYHPGMYMWKKLNLSGRLEPPLLVDEPRYVIARREYYDDDDYENYKRGLNYGGGDPFIPPRGRKHNLPDLDSLLHRYETFVPNRGRRDKIKDIFKYDDLFYPNRGKRQMTTAAAAEIDIDDIDESNDNDIKEAVVENDYYQPENNEVNVEQQFRHPLSYEMSSNPMDQIKNLMAKMKRKLHQNQLLKLQQQQEEEQQKIANSFDEMSRNKPTRMSTTFQQATPASTSSPSASSSSLSLLNKRFKSMFNILHKQQRKQQQQHLPNLYNARRQWLKRYPKTTTNNDRPASVRSRTMATNRLQTLRSMSPLQQLTLLHQQQQQHQKEQQQQHQQHHHHLQHQPDYLSPPLSKQATKFMWQHLQQKQSQPQLHLQQQQQQHALKSLAQQFDPLSWHKLQMLQHQYQHLPLLTMRHPRLTALQHLPTIQQQRQQQPQQLATPQETQLTYSSDQIDNSITNDLENFYNKDLD